MSTESSDTESVTAHQPEPAPKEEPIRAAEAESTEGPTQPKDPTQPGEPGEPELSSTAEADPSDHEPGRNQHKDRSEPTTSVAWRRLRKSLRPRANGPQVIVTVLCFVLGLSLAVQVRHQGENDLEAASPQELVRLLDESNRHVRDLENQSEELDRTLETLRESRTTDVAAQEAAEKRLNDMEILSGTVPAEGRGVRIRVDGDRGSLQQADLVVLIQELRNAGAEVIQVDDVRIVASSAVTTDDQGAVMVDGSPIPDSFVVLAIGDPEAIDPALRIPGGALDTLSAAGQTVSIQAEDLVTITATTEPGPRRYAEPTQ